MICLHAILTHSDKSNKTKKAKKSPKSSTDMSI